MRRRHEPPEIGTWYWNIKEIVPEFARFEILDTDKENGYIEIQYFSGEIDNLSEDTWFEMEVVSIAHPKDWSGPFDDVDKEEFPELGDETIHPKDRSGPLGRFR